MALSLLFTILNQRGQLLTSTLKQRPVSQWYKIRVHNFKYSGNQTSVVIQVRRYSEMFDKTAMYNLIAHSFREVNHHEWVF